MYKAIQTELVRIHTTEAQDNEDINRADNFRRRLTQLSEEGELDDIEYYEEEPPNEKRGEFKRHLLVTVLCTAQPRLSIQTLDYLKSYLMILLDIILLSAGDCYYYGVSTFKFFIIRIS